MSMTIKEFCKTTVPTDLPMGEHNDIIFNGIQYRADEDGFIKNAFVYIKGYRNLYLPIFQDEDRNYNLDALLTQLGETSRDPEKINKKIGTKIYVRKYLKDEFENVAFQPEKKDNLG